MKRAYLYTGAAIALAVVLKRRQAGAAAANTVQVGELGEGRITDGTNWTSTLWGRLSANDLSAAGSPNLGGSVIADPGTVGARQLGVLPGWNGSLA